MFKNILLNLKSLFNMKYTYFVSYDYIKKGDWGKSNSIITVNFKVKKISDIEYFENLLMKTNGSNTLKINNFIRL